jgi:hypothetical protein
MFERTRNGNINTRADTDPLDQVELELISLEWKKCNDSKKLNQSAQHYNHEDVRRTFNQ